MSLSEKTRKLCAGLAAEATRLLRAELESSTDLARRKRIAARVEALRAASRELRPAPVAVAPAPALARDDEARVIDPRDLHQEAYWLDRLGRRA